MELHVCVCEQRDIKAMGWFPDQVIVSVVLKKVCSLKPRRMGSLNIMVVTRERRSLLSERKSANLTCRLTQLSVVGTNTIRVLAFNLEHTHSNNVPAAANLSVKYYAGRLVMFPQSTLGFSFSLGLLNVSCHHSNRACQHSLTIALLLSHFLIPGIALYCEN